MLQEPLLVGFPEIGYLRDCKQQSYNGKKMKTISLSVFLSGLVFFVACGDKEEKSSESKAQTSAQTSEKTPAEKHAEMTTNINSIKTAQIQYESEYSMYVECEEYPKRSKDEKAWDVSKSGGFAKGGMDMDTMEDKPLWKPEGKVRGSYSVVTIGNLGSDFKITGVIDADGDGKFATYTATKSTKPTLVTDKAIY